jgi:hypothetical protein
MVRGMIAFILTLPWPWPCKSVTVLAQRGPVTLAADPSRALILQITNDRITSTFRSCRLVITEPTTTSVAVSWNLPEAANMIVGQTVVLSAEQNATVPAEAIIVSGIPNDLRDFSQQNTEALRKRFDKLAGSRGDKKLKPRRQVTAAEIFSELERVHQEIADLLLLVAQGKSHHVRGLLSALHLAIIDEKHKPLPLLQLCAATINAPLIVYAPPVTDCRKPWPLPGMESLAYLISATPGALTRNAVDLDVWLASRATQADGKVLSQRELMSKVANSIGRHFDLYVPAEVDMLRDWKSGIDGVDLDFLNRYTTAVSNAVQSVISAILAAKPNS